MPEPEPSPKDLPPWPTGAHFGNLIEARVNRQESRLIELEIKPTARLVQLIARTERLAGHWDRLSSSEALASASAAQTATARGVSLALQLDPSPLEPDQSRLIAAHLSPTPFPESAAELAALQTELCGAGLRRSAGVLAAPPAFFTGEAVFATTPPFLIQQRLEELLRWLQLELSENSHHPALVISTFHLLFLQLSPFASGNHRLSLLLVWQLLSDHGFDFVRYRHFLEALAGSERPYFVALRQAERTARGNWSTLNAWLELFLTLLKRTVEELIGERSREEERLGLTETQLSILEAVRRLGSPTREKVAADTGVLLSTVKYNLGVLTSRGYIRRNGAGRTTNYSAV